MVEKRDLESLLSNDVISVSSRESDTESDHDSDPGENVKSEASDATRLKKKQQHAKPDNEPDLELRNEIEDIVAQVTQWKEKLAKKQEDVYNMEKIAPGKSFEDLDELKERYRKSVENFNENRKNGFKDFELAWNGFCPGCCQCTGQQPTLKPKHAIESLDARLDAMTIATFSEGVVALNERLLAIQTEALGQQEEEKEDEDEEKKEKEDGEEEEDAGTL